jgi:signal transduction histidine kinase/CHASE3 domain sensor protein
MSIKKRIYLSFFLLVSLFGVYSIVTIITLNNNRILSKRMSEVMNPLLQVNSDFNKLLIESKMYTTNWVFLRSKQEDKEALVNLHEKRYSQLKIKTYQLLNRISSTPLRDSLNKEFASFEELIGIEKQIMSTLVAFEDYDDPFKRLNSENIIETEVLPRTDVLMQMHDRIRTMEQGIQESAQSNLEESTTLMRRLILLLMAVILIFGFLLSKYLTYIISTPIRKIVRVVNDTGKGILEKVNWKETRDEIGEMVRSVNNLSTKLKTTAEFADEIGKRNFDMPFKPLSDNDTLGKALITMRDNLKSSDERLDQAQTIARLGNWESDMELKFIWSKEMYSILDYEPFEIEASYQALIKYIDMQDKGKLQRLMAQCLKSGESFIFNGQITTAKNNTKSVRMEGRLSITHKEGKQEQKIIGIMQDITEQVKSAVLEAHNSELTKANLELDKFVYSCSHDLRAPLTSMLGIIEISKEETSDPVMMEHLAMMKKSINKLDGFISDILDYSRNSRMEIKKEEIDFSEVLADITNDLKYMSGNNVKVEIKVDRSSSAPFLSDKSRINIVLNNLVSNAIRYQNPKIIDPFVDIKVDTSDTETHIVVKDNGIGIPGEHQQKIFDMFYRVSKNSVGSGLGLYIVKEAIDKLNGRIEVESEIGKGTTFNVYIPNN